jgi:hypothetical protein
MGATFCFLGSPCGSLFFALSFSQSFVLVRLEGPCHPLSKLAQVEQQAGELKFSANIQELKQLIEE